MLLCIAKMSYRHVQRQLSKYSRSSGYFCTFSRSLLSIDDVNCPVIQARQGNVLDVTKLLIFSTLEELYFSFFFSFSGFLSVWS